ncbi:hypothetical protein [Rhodobacter sp. NSM]
MEMEKIAMKQSLPRCDDRPKACLALSTAADAERMLLDQDPALI